MFQNRILVKTFNKQRTAKKKKQDEDVVELIIKSFTKSNIIHRLGNPFEPEQMRKRNLYFPF